MCSAASSRGVQLLTCLLSDAARTVHVSVSVRSRLGFGCFSLILRHLSVAVCGPAALGGGGGGGGGRAVNTMSTLLDSPLTDATWTQQRGRTWGWVPARSSSNLGFCIDWICEDGVRSFVQEHRPGLRTGRWPRVNPQRRRRLLLEVLQRSFFLRSARNSAQREGDDLPTSWPGLKL